MGPLVYGKQASYSVDPLPHLAISHTWLCLSITARQSGACYLPSTIKRHILLAKLQPSSRFDQGATKVGTTLIYSPVRHLISEERIPFTATYFGSIALTLYFAIGVSLQIHSPKVRSEVYGAAHLIHAIPLHPLVLTPKSAKPVRALTNIMCFLSIIRRTFVLPTQAPSMHTLPSSPHWACARPISHSPPSSTSSNLLSLHIDCRYWPNHTCRNIVVMQLISSNDMLTSIFSHSSKAASSP